MTNLSRREFIKSAGVYGLALFLSSCLPEVRGKTEEAAAIPFDDALIDVEYQLTAMPDSVQLFEGDMTEVWRYQSEVIKGTADNLVELEGSYLGPIFHVRKGQIVRIHFKNELPEKSIVHWHGLHVPIEADGHPRFAVENGEEYVYTFEVMDRAGTYWFHPHPHGRTGPQVYAGMAGLFIVHDDEEDALSLPSGEYDLPFVIQDRIFSSNNQLDYSSNSMMSQMVGFLGNQILINGVAGSTYQVSQTAYRFRLLNGSNSRIYKLGWKDGSPLTVIGTDGGLLAKPIARDFITLAPAQRIELWVDFSDDEIGKTKQLFNLAHNAPGGGGEFQVMSFEVNAGSENSISLPVTLSTPDYHDSGSATNEGNPRYFSLSMGRGMQFLLNDRTYEMEAVADDEVVRLGDLEVWEFENLLTGAGMMGGMAIPHPMHVHGLQFQIIERDWINVDNLVWGDLKAGDVDEGWHDTVLCYPGEKVKILMKFEDYAGLYLYHCHNLEHEDMGMMRNYLVEG